MHGRRQWVPAYAGMTIGGGDDDWDCGGDDWDCGGDDWDCGDDIIMRSRRPRCARRLREGASISHVPVAPAALLASCGRRAVALASLRAVGLFPCEIRFLVIPDKRRSGRWFSRLGRSVRAIRDPNLCGVGCGTQWTRRRTRGVCWERQWVPAYAGMTIEVAGMTIGGGGDDRGIGDEDVESAHVPLTFRPFFL